jgi:hypothetical protein
MQESRRVASCDPTAVRRCNDVEYASEAPNVWADLPSKQCTRQPPAQCPSARIDSMALSSKGSLALNMRSRTTARLGGLTPTHGESRSAPRSTALRTIAGGLRRLASQGDLKLHPDKTSFIDFRPQRSRPPEKLVSVTSRSSTAKSCDDRVGVVQDAVKDGGGQRAVVVEDLGPMFVGAVVGTRRCWRSPVSAPPVSRVSAKSIDDALGPIPALGFPMKGMILFVSTLAMIFLASSVQTFGTNWLGQVCPDPGPCFRPEWLASKARASA